MIKKILAICLRSFAVLLLLLILIGTFLVTPYGFSTSLWLTKKILPGQLTYQKAEGALIGPIDIKNISYNTPQFSIKIDELHFNWNPLPLVLKRLSISSLKIDNVQYIMHKHSSSRVGDESDTDADLEQAVDDSFDLTKFSLPFEVDVQQGLIQNVNIIHIKKKPIHINAIKLQGEVSNEKMNFNLEADVNKPQAIAANFKVSGSIKNYQVKLSVQSHNLQLRLSGVGDQHKMSLVTTDNKFLGGRLTAKLNVNLYHGLHWQFALTAGDMHLTQLDKALPAKISVKLNSKGSFVHNEPDIKLTSLIKTPSGHIDLKAHIAKTIQTTWDATMTDLSDISSLMRGKLFSKGGFTGTLNNPVTQGKIQLQAFQYKKDTLHSLNAQWDIKGLTQAQSFFKLSLQSLAIGGHQFPSGSVAANGNLRRQRLDVDVKSDEGAFQTKISGDYTKQRWQLNMNELSIKSALFDDWSLPSPIKLTILDNGNVSLPKKCIYSVSQQSVCIDANKKSGQWALHVHGNNVKTKEFRILEQKNIHVRGRTTLNLDVNGEDKSISHAKLNLHFDKGHVDYFINGKKSIRLFLGGDIVAVFKDNNINGKVHFDFLKKDYISLNFNTDQDRDEVLGMDTALQGHLKIAMHDLGFISNYIPSVGIEDGVFNTDVLISGTLGNPQYSGNIGLNTATVSIPTAGLELTQLAMNFKVENSLAKISIHALSSGDPLAIEGMADFSKNNFKTQLHLTGNSVLVINMPRYRVFATPDVKFAYGGHKISIKGTLTIPEATLKLQKSVTVVNMPESEIEYVGLAADQSKPGDILDLDLHLQLSKQVHVEAAGLAANITGKLHLYTSKKGTILANGTVAVLKGHFAAYGHSMSIADHSFVQYVESPIGNPILNIKAYKDIKAVGGFSPQQFNFDDLVVGVVVTGRVSNMHIGLYSVPAGLSQQDILSYLLFGYAGAGTGGLGGLTQTLQETGGLSAIPSTFKNTLGLSEFGVENHAVLDAGGQQVGQQNAFVLGKQISRQLYLRYVYNYGLYQPGNVFQIRYNLGKKWILQSDGGDYGAGLDILYNGESKN